MSNMFGPKREEVTKDGMMRRLTMCSSVSRLLFGRSNKEERDGGGIRNLRDRRGV